MPSRKILRARGRGSKSRSRVTDAVRVFRSFSGPVRVRISNENIAKVDVFGKVSENCAIIKFTVTDPEKMNQVMSKRIPEIAPSIGLEHEIFTLSQVE